MDMRPDLADLLRAYSKRPDILDGLNRAGRRLAGATTDAGNAPDNVRSTGRVGRAIRMCDRLSDDQVRCLVSEFRIGTTKNALAEQYGMSRSSVQRILRAHRTEER